MQPTAAFGLADSHCEAKFLEWSFKKIRFCLSVTAAAPYTWLTVDGDNCVVPTTRQISITSRLVFEEGRTPLFSRNLLVKNFVRLISFGYLFPCIFWTFAWNPGATISYFFRIFFFVSGIWCMEYAHQIFSNSGEFVRDTSVWVMKQTWWPRDSNTLYATCFKLLIIK